MSADRMLTVDVAVVGAGLAGHVAALVAAEAGATVCLVEKQSEFGGSSVKAGGGLLFAGTELQEAAGFADDPARLRDAILDAGQRRNDPVVVGAYVDHQLTTYRWLRERGLVFSLAPANANMPVPRLHVAVQDLTAALHRHVETMPAVTYRPDAPARRLVRDTGGRVAGVRVSWRGEDALVNARLGVILTTGGFSRSRELLQSFAPRWVEAAKMGGSGTTGDGLRMAAALGAQLVDMGYIEATFGASAGELLGPRPGDQPRLLFAHADGAIIVNRAGRRFADESLSYKTLGRICADQPDEVAFQLFDSTVMARSRPRPTPRDYRRALADGLIVEAPTVRELAQLIGVDAGTLQATVDQYNDDVRSGVDREWGRPIGLGHPTGGLLETPPFCAFPCRPGLTATYCGLKVDQRMRVTDVFGDVIPRLFAAGEVVGGFHGAGYLTGTALGKAAVFGYIAGRNASNQAVRTK